MGLLVGLCGFEGVYLRASELAGIVGLWILTLPYSPNAKGLTSSNFQNTTAS